MSFLTSDGATLRAFADSVLPVVLAVIGGVLAEAEPGSVAVQDEDDGPDLLWATFAGRRMVFRYNVRTGMIELRDGTTERLC